MFFVAITNERIAHKFQSLPVDEYRIDSMTATIVTDNFLSQFHSEPDGFSIVESPVRDSPRSGELIYTEVRFNHKDRLLTVFKVTMSGRPVYYQIDSKGNFFCSTHISVLRMAGVEIAENALALPEFFVFRRVVPPETLYRNIRKFSFGGRLCLRVENGKTTLQSAESYCPPEPDRTVRSIQASAETIHDHLLGLIDCLRPFKAETTALLSGGIDSSILVRMCQETLGLEDSYSTAFPMEEPRLELEKQYAISAGKALGMNHLCFEMTTQDYLTGFLEAIALAEEPLHHLQSVLLHVLYREGIPDSKRIIVEGAGGGPYFGNFRSYLYMKDKIVYQVLTRQPLRAMLATVSRMTGRGRGFVGKLEDCASRYPLSDPAHPLWTATGWYGSKKWVCDYFGVAEGDIIKREYDSVREYETRSIYDVASVHTLEDEAVTISIWAKIAEGNGKVPYYPLYNDGIINFVYSIPWKVKLRRPQNALRSEIARLSGVPEFIIRRPKSGFSIRSRRWAMRGGPLEPLVPLALKVFDEKQLRGMQSTDIDKAMTFWNMLNYAIWKRLCVDNEPLGVLMDELNEATRKHP